MSYAVTVRVIVGNQCKTRGYRVYTDRGAEAAIRIAERHAMRSVAGADDAIADRVLAR
jgi:squalene cyclase